MQNMPEPNLMQTLIAGALTMVTVFPSVLITGWWMKRREKRNKEKR